MKDKILIDKENINLYVESIQEKMENLSDSSDDREKYKKYKELLDLIENSREYLTI